MALWGGRFASGPADSVAALSRSVHFDWRLAPYDLRVNIAHTRGLMRANLLTADDGAKIIAALLELASEIESGTFTYNDGDEDVHSAIERGLTAKLGALGGAFRAGRSRNDLVATDFRLYLLDHMLQVSEEIVPLISAILTQSKGHLETIAPGFTHYQHAQPIVFGHELAKHAHSLLRDLDRIEDWYVRSNISPLGAGAMAGSGLLTSPEIAATELGFAQVHHNSIDAVSDRDWVAEALFICAQIAIHLSRLGEEFTLWSSSEFGWAKLDDAFSTGSSIMPQKKNPDIAELARGKSGRLIGNLTGLLATTKGLAFAYNRDLQEDKEPVFDTVETLLVLLPAVVGMVQTTKFQKEKISAGASAGHALATEIADFLVRAGIPFATGHEISGACVQRAEALGVEVHELPANEFAQIHSALTPEFVSTLNAASAVAARTSIGGTAPISVAKQIEQLQTDLAGATTIISKRVEDFSGMMSA